MFTGFAGTSVSSRKRKNKEVVNEETAAEVQRNAQEFPPLQIRSPQLEEPQSNNQQQVSQVVSTDLTLTNQAESINELFLRRCFVPADPSPPLTQGQGGASAAAADARLHQHIAEIQQFMSVQAHHTQTALSSMWWRHYHETISATGEAMDKRLREKEAEMEKAKQAAELWEGRARALEQIVASLKTALRRTLEDVSINIDDTGRMTKEGEAESSYVDPRRAEGGVPQLPCNICRTKLATVMMWPCRHVTVCAKCEKLTNKCPLCLSPKDSCLSVFIA